MAFLGIAPSIMKPTALVLSLVVATIALARFQRAGFFSQSLLWPFALGSIPAAFIARVLYQWPGSVIAPPVLFYSLELFN